MALYWGGGLSFFFSLNLNYIYIEIIIIINFKLIYNICISIIFVSKTYPFE